MDRDSGFGSDEDWVLKPLPVDTQDGALCISDIAEFKRTRPIYPVSKIKWHLKIESHWTNHGLSVEWPSSEGVNYKNYNKTGTENVGIGCPTAARNVDERGKGQCITGSPPLLPPPQKTTKNNNNNNNNNNKHVYAHIVHEFRSRIIQSREILVSKLGILSSCRVAGQKSTRSDTEQEDINSRVFLGFWRSLTSQPFGLQW